MPLTASFYSGNRDLLTITRQEETVKKIRKTKIVATLGPATESREAMEKLLNAGMNIARFNFSHGTHDYHKKLMKTLREASRETDIPVAIMLDTKGPEIRTGMIRNDEKITLNQGTKITLTTQEVEGTPEMLSISYKKLPEQISSGSHIFIADGLINLEVLSVQGTEMECRVVAGGTIGSRKNVNIPGIHVDLPTVTEKDRKDIIFGIEQNIDFISASFIRQAEDVITIKNIAEEKGSSVKVIAKIENQEGIDNIDDIVRTADGIMVARGDLGVQLETERIPLAQKMIIKNCNTSRKPVITATQMLDSMINNPKPTRAELTDVANAIFDGTDAVMLSGETATGKYPFGAVEMMDRIARSVENSEEYISKMEGFFTLHRNSDDIGLAVAKAAYLVATEVGARAIITPTIRGNSPRIISSFRPRQIILAVSPAAEVRRQLLLNWGIFPLEAEQVQDSDEMMHNALKAAFTGGYIKKLDRVVTAAGIPVNSPLMLNTIKVHFLGNILNRGHRAFGATCSGRIIKAASPEEAKREVAGYTNPILLVKNLDKGYREVIPKLRGIILEGRSELSEEDIRVLNDRIVLIAEVPGAFDTLEEQLLVSLDGQEKIIYEGYVAF